MLTREQKISVLREVEKQPNGGSYATGDSEIYNNLDDIEPYVIGYTRYTRSFAHRGLSELGRKLLESL